VPQWNCGCENCALARAGSPEVSPRTQDSIAITGSGDRWLVINASPDVCRQLEQTPALHPQSRRHTPIAAVALLNGDLDHVTGLLSLRESQHFSILATARVRSGLVERNVMMRTLARTPDQVTWRTMELAKELVLEDVGVAVVPVAVPGKLPIHLVGVLDPSLEDNVALRVRDLRSGRTVVVATAAGSLDGAQAWVAGADVVFFDGTFWTEDEMVTGGLGRARAQDMAHVPIGGPDGSLARLRLPESRRIYTHVNNSNPVLRRSSAERAAVERAGWEVAYDGMEVLL
jgi:pyrroloquinoline quinone biosynthesis protein B